MRGFHNLRVSNMKDVSLWWQSSGRSQNLSTVRQISSCKSQHPDGVNFYTTSRYSNLHTTMKYPQILKLMAQTDDEEHAFVQSKVVQHLLKIMQYAVLAVWYGA